MATLKSVWGIDIGQCALKALKLSNVEGELRLEAFDVIEHAKILSQPDADRDELVRSALEQFLARNSIAGSAVVVSAPGQSGFTRFVKLPPVESKQVPEIVRFEAEQQIPFNINEVIWRWQAFQDANSPDVEVGIFAMKRTDVSAVLDRYTDVGIAVDAVQMGLLSLYNFMDFDGQAAPEGATLLVDVGADKSDLVVSDGSRIWTRTVQLGGNNFTEALVKSFKLSFAKAEKLKRTAATSKYARQIFQAMRPVFAELTQEIQRSIGYYTSLHRDSRFQRVVGIGNGFRLPGLQKFLEQNLGITVIRPDGYNKLSPTEAVNAPAFTENVLSFAVAYGLALQGLEMTKIRTNLLPGEIVRKRVWAKKQPWFAATAAAVLMTFGVIAYRSFADESLLNPQGNAVLADVRTKIDAYNKLRREYTEYQGKDRAEIQRINQYMAMLEFRGFWPAMQNILSDALAKDTDQDKLTTDKLGALKAIPRGERKVLLIESMTSQYRDSFGNRREDFSGGAAAPEAVLPGAATPGAPGGAAPGTPGAKPSAAPAASTNGRGYVIILKGTTPSQNVDFINNIKEAVVALGKNSPALEVLSGQIMDFKKKTVDAAAAAAGGAATTKVLDPLTGEDASGDYSFEIGWRVMIKDKATADAAAAPGARR